MSLFPARRKRRVSSERATLEELLGEELRLRSRDPMRIAGVGQWVPMLAARRTVVDAGDLVADRSVGDVIDIELDGSFIGTDEQDQPTRVEFPWVASGIDYVHHTQQYTAALVGDRQFTTIIEVCGELKNDVVEPATNGDFCSVGYIASASAVTMHAYGWEWQGAGAANRRGYLQLSGVRKASSFNDGIVYGYCASMRTGGSGQGYDASGARVDAQFQFGGFNPWVTDGAPDPLAMFFGLVGAGRCQLRGWYRAICVLDREGYSARWKHA